MDTALVAFGSAIAGAFVGGGVTAAAAYAGAASEKHQKARAKIYLDLLPQYKQTEPGTSQSEVMEEIERTADISGPRCIYRAAEMRRAFDSLHRPQAPSDPVKTSPGGSTFVDRDAEEHELDQVIEEFNAWLRRRVRPAGSYMDPRTWKAWGRLTFQSQRR